MTLSLDATDVDDPYGGRDDIYERRYRFIRHRGQASATANVAAVLRYACALLALNPTSSEITSQPGLDEARAALADAISTTGLMELQESAQPRAVVRRLVAAVVAAAPSPSILRVLMEKLEWETFVASVHRAGIVLPTMRIPTPSTAVIDSHRVGGDFTRLDGEGTWGSGSDAIAAFDECLRNVGGFGGVTMDREQPVLGPGQEILLASPIFHVHVASNLDNRDAWFDQGEFVHFDVQLPAEWSASKERRLHSASTDSDFDEASLGLIAFVRTGPKEAWEAFGVPCAAAVVKGGPDVGPRLQLRANCWHVLSEESRWATRGRWESGIRFFVVGWTGQP
jgi:hypothetical protein